MRVGYQEIIDELKSTHPIDGNMVKGKAQHHALAVAAHFQSQPRRRRQVHRLQLGR